MAAVLVCTTALACADASHQITVAGWGPVKVGMTPAEAAATLGTAFEVPPGAIATDDCHYRTTPAAPGLLFMVEDGRIVRVETKERTYSTPSGVRVGDTEEDAMRADAGRADVRPHKYTTSGHCVVLLAADGKRAVVVETDKGRVVAIRGGLRPAVEYVEGCS